MKKILLAILILFIFYGSAYAVIVGYSRTAQGGSLSLFEWACEDLTAEVFDVTDGGTITPDSDTTPSYSFVTGTTGNAIQIDSGTWVWFNASQGNNINYEDITMSFDYRFDSGTPSNSTWIINTQFTTPDQFSVRRSTPSDTQWVIQYAGNQYVPSFTENVFNGSFHSIIINIVAATQTLDITIDGTEYNIGLTATTVANPDTPQRIYLNGVNSTFAVQQVSYDNFIIQ